MQAPILVLNQDAKRETGRKAQLTNIAAAKAVSDIIRTTLGPRAMLKMILDAMGGIVLTNDGNAILREVDVSHPAAKSMIELSKTQDDEVGDGTTSVTVLAGEILSLAEPFLTQNVHPTVIVRGLSTALDDAVAFADTIAVKIGSDNMNEKVENVVKSCLGTKFVSRYRDLMITMAVEAIKTVTVTVNDKTIIDFKTFAKVEKIPGGEISESKVLKGVLFDKDVCTSNMRRFIKNPRILLIDCPLEYRKAESTTNVEITKEEDWQRLLELEEEYVANQCSEILKFKPDLVICEKGVSDLALHILAKNNVSVLRRLRKTDNIRVAKATGATIISRTDEIKESDIGVGAGVFKVEKFGDSYFSIIEDCSSPKACTILLRGGSKDVLNEIERNLQDAMCVARNIFLSPFLVPGGGAFEMAISRKLHEKAQKVEGLAQGPYRALAEALEVIPRTLAENCGAQVVRLMTTLRAKHFEEGQFTYGLDGNTGQIADMKILGIWDPLVVKIQTVKTAVEAATLLLRIDDIVSGISKRQNADNQPQGEADDLD